MDFTYQERNIISDIIESASTSLFDTLKYTYIISYENFYNINVKDVFKVALSDISNPELLKNLGIPLSDDILGEMASLEFKRIKGMIHYAFAIRIPFLRRYNDSINLRDSQIKELYTLAIKRGADNYGGIVDGDLRSMMKLVKNKQNEPDFDSEWFRRWVYTCAKELSAINNRNMFLLGATDAMFPLYYSALMEKLTQTILNINTFQSSPPVKNLLSKITK